ncbi:MAG: PocR ligand-binding domain-containing protein [Oscillospiraceae bacterium]|nr:PocR ligand-binding domain-containing protein [Oscillospiraceae bacterium]
MNITELIDAKTLQRYQDLFSNATGLAAIAVDVNGNYATEGSNFTDFCMKYTRGCPEGARRCQKCDNEGKGTYFCHAGLMDFSTDIIVDGQKVGAIIGGQVLPVEPNHDKFRQIARELGINEDEYIEALKKVPVRSEKMIRSAAELLGSFINQLANLEYYKKLNAEKMSEVEEYQKQMPKTLEAVRNIKSKMNELHRVATMENLLALNASIEASKAGQAGVGFAIVARQMGELSNSSSKTYDEIESLIDSISKMK